LLLRRAHTTLPHGAMARGAASGGQTGGGKARLYQSLCVPAKAGRARACRHAGYRAALRTCGRKHCAGCGVSAHGFDVSRHISLTMERKNLFAAGRLYCDLLFTRSACMGVTSPVDKSDDGELRLLYCSLLVKNVGRLLCTR